MSAHSARDAANTHLRDLAATDVVLVRKGSDDGERGYSGHAQIEHVGHPLEDHVEAAYRCEGRLPTSPIGVAALHYRLLDKRRSFAVDLLFAAGM